MARFPPLHVLAEGEHWIVVAKRPRLLVHRNIRAPKADACLQRVRNQVGRRVYPIHRLDRQASGCLLFGKTQSWAGPLQASLGAADATKTYVAFVRGFYAHDEIVTVDNPMKDDNGRLKDAETRFEMLGRSHEPRCSLVRAWPQTGRFHQVRRHIRDLHHPCIGDSEHGDSKINRWWRENTGANRLGLHCIGLALTLPDGERIDVACPLFEDQHAVFTQMPWWSDALAREPRLGLPPLPMEQAIEEATPPPDAAP